MEKVYEMDDDYKQAVADLLEFIKARDQLAETVKHAAPDRIKEGQRLLIAADKRIEEMEAALAAEYDAHQAAEKSREEYEQKLNEMQEAFDAGMEYLAADHPETHKKILAQINGEEG